MAPTPKTHTVRLMPDTVLNVPQLWLDVYVEGDKREEAAFANWLSRAACKRAETPEKADLVIFTGGEDVNPALYNAKPHQLTRFNEARDEREIELYRQCLEEGIPMLGICRGAQFLHVMNGGVLYQHVDGHNTAHNIYDINKQEHIAPVSSVHHQMCKFNPDGRQLILADSLDATKRWLDNDTVVDGRMADIEAYFYRQSVCLGFDGLAEYRGYDRYSNGCLDILYDYIVCNTDIELRNQVRRVKTEILEERRHLRDRGELFELPSASIH